MGRVEAHKVIFSILNNEMKNRIESIVGTDARSLWMGTFHSIFARILRAEGHKIGYPSNYVIYDTQDSKSLIKSKSFFQLSLL